VVIIKVSVVPKEAVADSFKESEALLSIPSSKLVTPLTLKLIVGSPELDPPTVMEVRAAEEAVLEGFVTVSVLVTPLIDAPIVLEIALLELTIFLLQIL